MAPSVATLRLFPDMLEESMLRVARSFLEVLICIVPESI
jgi:hypothetical protein